MHGTNRDLVETKHEQRVSQGKIQEKGSVHCSTLLVLLVIHKYYACVPCLILSDAVLGCVCIITAYYTQQQHTERGDDKADNWVQADVQGANCSVPIVRIIRRRGGCSCIRESVGDQF